MRTASCRVRRVTREGEMKELERETVQKLANIKCGKYSFVQTRETRERRAITESCLACWGGRVRDPEEVVPCRLGLS